MNDMSYFTKFITPSNPPVVRNNDVWLYTRVSSKDQFDKNSSVTFQLEAGIQYAKQNKFNITRRFGGTYESAKSDHARKFFSEMIDEVISSKNRSFAIIVYKASRFSRTGADAMALVKKLVFELGVNLIELSTGISTTTERGWVAIQDSLFHAYKEQLERREVILPAMKSHIMKGKRFGSSPPGYDHYGPRVRNEKFLSKQQKFEINKDGEILKEPWQWLLSGHYSQSQILKNWKCAA